ncbi:hypothetical protein [Cellulomonas sp. RIT-PI-Y]|uniref:hypothetical protein n=1 Tax=Cellulomonas sp. RIT-PI-Y TaxID=3035297 RepID=UPI0021DB0BB9|nr:hypothetical protein [Cellulomonas sp. RIT-PI-Y]
MNRHVAALTTAVILALSACAADDPAPAPTPTTYTASPLAEAVPLLSLGQDEQARIDREAERLIAICLKEQGFDYDRPYVADDPVLDADTDPVEWAAQYGYGVSTLDLITPSTSSTPRSTAEQAAYDAALYGVGTETDAAYDWEQEGCLGAAYHEATDGADEVMRDERFAALFEAVDTAQIEVDASPAVLALRSAWSDCMAGAGYPELASPVAARQSVQEQLTAEADLAELRAHEVALAIADLDCRESTSYDRRYCQELWSAQATVADEFAEEIDALTASAG